MAFTLGNVTLISIYNVQKISDLVSAEKIGFPFCLSKSMDQGSFII